MEQIQESDSYVRRRGLVANFGSSRPSGDNRPADRHTSRMQGLGGFQL